MYLFHVIGVSLFDGWTSKECQAVSETITTKHSDYYGTNVA